jgi:hypothetical protein
VIDVVRVAHGLQESEMFVVLDGEDSYWSHVQEVGAFGGSVIQSEIEDQIIEEEIGFPTNLGTKDEFAEMFPGTDFIAARAEFAVTKGAVVFNRNKRRQNDFEYHLEHSFAHGLRASERRITGIAARHGDETADQWLSVLGTSEDLELYAEELARETLDPVDFYLKVAGYATRATSE